MLNVDTIKEKVNLFREEIGKLEITSEDVEMFIAIAKQEVSEAAQHVITKTRQKEQQLLESLEMTRRKRIKLINSAKQELESLVNQMNQAAEFAEKSRSEKLTLGYYTDQDSFEAEIPRASWS